MFKYDTIIGPTPPGQHSLPRRATGICARAIVPYGQLFAPILNTAVVSEYKDGGNEWSGNISRMDLTGNSGTYSRAYTYDLHGNILSLTTPSGTVNVSYSGNRRAGSYTYDSNGNLTSDQDAGLTGMTYNALNLLSGYTHSADGYDTRITYTASGENTNSPIVWTTSMSRDFFVNIPTTATSRRVYFYVEFNGQVSPTYSVLCKIPPIPAFILVDDSGKLYTEDMDTPFAEVKSDTFGETYLFSCLGHELVFDHFPTWSEFCAEMLMSEDFVNTVKMLKPWGEKEQIMIPYSYTENGDTFEDYLTLIYKKNNIFAEESGNE